MENAIHSFTGEYRFLSNFYPSPIIVPIVYSGYNHKDEVALRIQHIEFPTVEHAYVATKTMDPNLQLEISKVKKSGEVKKLGRKINLRSDWDEVKLSIMNMLVRKKFISDWNLTYKLISTEDKELIEGNTWGDTYWGVCRGEGENNLGKILMKVREELRARA